ncbi:hypothetical protein ACQ856_18365 [Mycolicibacterium psychrotolerans]|uniref:hypothetical protein n=1 Tax=Mycolicibacterium psychrotolerans TaxID=216929 RepID=UPI003D671BBB
MPAGKFTLNRRTVSQIAKHDGKLADAVDDVAAEVAHRSGPGATVDTYTTDRHVGGVIVGAADQARDGVATKAAQSVAAGADRPPTRGGVRGFSSRAEWRHEFARGASNADARARASRAYHSLPERKGTR